MSTSRAPKVIGAAMACTAFAIACVAGVAAHNPSNVVLTRALIALFVCYFAGMLLGYLGELIVAQHLAIYAKQNPIPEVAPLVKEPVIIAEVAEDQAGTGLASGAGQSGPGGSQVAQVAQKAQSAQGDRKAA